MGKKVVCRSGKDGMAAIKQTLSLDERSLKVYKGLAKKLNLSMSGVLRLIATKFEDGTFKL